jgi:hypothetical protein
VLLGVLPHCSVGCPADAKDANVERIGKDIGQQHYELFGQLFIEEQAHRLRRDAECSTFAFGRVGQAGPDVVARQLRKLPEDLVLGRPAGQVPQDVTDSDARASDARLAESDIRVNRDPMRIALLPAVSRYPVIGPTPGFSRGGNTIAPAAVG